MKKLLYNKEYRLIKYKCKNKFSKKISWWTWKFGKIKKNLLSTPGGKKICKTKLCLCICGSSKDFLPFQIIIY